MAFDWEKFDKQVDLEALAADVEEVEKNGGLGDYEPIPDGQYEVKIEKMELKQSWHSLLLWIPFAFARESMTLRLVPLHIGHFIYSTP